MTIEKLDEILLELNYYDNFKNNYLYKTYKEIDYGKQIGKLKFNSFFDAAENYKYSEKLGEEVFKQWNLILSNEKSTDLELFITSLEIFDWGNVYKGNIKTAINLYKKKELKP